MKDGGFGPRRIRELIWRCRVIGLGGCVWSWKVYGIQC